MGDQRRNELLAKMNVPGIPLGRGLGAEGLEIKFRPSPLGLVPYLEIPLRDSAGVFSGRLALSEVVQGPMQDPEPALGSLTLYLESQHYNVHTTIRATGIPLRT